MSGRPVYITQKYIMKDILSDLRTYWRFLVIFLTPIILSPILIFISGLPAKCAYIILWMIVYWMTEVLPLPATALMPLFLYPLTGVLSASQVSIQYLKDSNFVFFGSLLLAMAVEHCQLHRRVGLLVLIKIGSSARRLMLGFMISTCFLSMWMSNTAATAMMVPLVLAILQELVETEQRGRTVVITATEADLTVSSPHAPTIIQVESCNQSNLACSQTLEHGAEVEASETQAVPESTLHAKSLKAYIEANAPKKFLRTCKGLLLSICYAANIGGTGTLTGTSSNMVLTGQLDSVYSSKDTGVTFASWMAFSTPQMVVILFLAWFWLQMMFLGVNLRKTDKIADAITKSVLERKRKELPPMSFAEKTTLIVFILLIALWLTRKPGFMPGWETLFPKNLVSDGTAAMMMGCLLFVLPRDKPQLATFSKPDANKKLYKYQPLITWDDMQKKFSWGIVILLGGGYAMAAGVQSSGLDNAISLALSDLRTLPTYAFLTIGVVAVTFLTEFSSNVAVASIFVPIAASVADQIHVNPLYIMIPITIACSFAFMLPVATPPNAIVFGAGFLHVVDMALAGFAMNIICMAVLLINTNTYGSWLFAFDTYPLWAMKNTSFVKTNSSLSF